MPMFLAAHDVTAASSTTLQCQKMPRSKVVHVNHVEGAVSTKRRDLPVV